jgi:hypothetical protein
MIIRDCLGRERPVDKSWPDGSYNCPFCFAAAKVDPVTFAGGCPNPACTARVDQHGALNFPVHVAQARLIEAEKRATAERERAEIEEFRRNYAKERSAERQEALEAALVECRDRRACERCLLKALGGGYGKAKFIKHRGPCPLAPKARPPA